MRLYDLVILTLIIVLATSLASIWFYPSRQEFMEGNPLWDGIQDYLRDSGAKNIDTLVDLPVLYSKSVLIAIPYLDYQPEEMQPIKQFINEGGTLILMDDFGFSNRLLEYLGITIQIDHRLLLDPLFCYKNQNLPLITDFSASVKEAGVTNLIFNHASVLNSVEKKDALAWSSSASFLDTNNNGLLDKNEPQGPFTVAAVKKINKGTVYIISDTSLVLNSMIEKNDNRAFLNYFFNPKGQPEVLLIDRSHLPKSNLDVSKIKIASVRMFFSNPYILIGVCALVFMLIIRYIYSKREKIID